MKDSLAEAKAHKEECLVREIEEHHKRVTKDQALEALDVLSAQVGNARLREMWKKPLLQYLMQGDLGMKGIEKAQNGNVGQSKGDEGKDAN